MRITIDTELQAIIVPDSYYMQVDKLNEIIIECGGQPLDYTRYIKSCFEKAYASSIIRQGELKNIRKKKPEGKGMKEKT